MKRWTTLLLIPALLLSLCACGGQPAPEATEPPAAAPTAAVLPEASPEPETSPATVLVNRLGAVYRLLKAGQELTLTGEDGQFYMAQLEGVTVYVEKRFIRLATQEAFKERGAYALSDMPFYGGVYLTGDALRTLALNTPLTVLQELGDCLMVQLEDGSVGFVPAQRVANAPVEYQYFGGDSGGSGGGGADGADITLGAAIAGDAPALILLAAAEKPAYPLSGMVLADGVEAYLRFFSRGDTVKVAGTKGELTELLVDGLSCTVPSLLLRAQGEKAYEARDGYAGLNALIFDSWTMTGQGQSPVLNSPVVVLEDFGGFCYVQWEKGEGFMLSSQVLEAPLVWSYSDPGSSGGGSSAWTKPVK